MSATELEREREALGLPPDGPSAESIAERAENGDYEEELFPLGSVEGDEKTVKNLIAGNLPVEITVSLMSAEVPSPRGGLLDAAREGQLIISHEPSKYILVPKREGEPGNKRVVGWKVRQQIRPTYVQRAKMFTREEVLDILTRAGIPSSADIIPELLGEE